MTTRRVLGAVLVLVAAGLAVAASVLVVYSVKAEVGRRSLVLEVTSWGVTKDEFPGGLLLVSVEYGLPVMVAALVMALSAVFSFRVPLARLGSLFGAGFLAGVAWFAVVSVGAVQERIEDVGLPLTFEQGDGLVLLLVAAVVGVVAGVLHQELPWQRVARREVPADGVVIHQLDDDEPGDDSDTPPWGFPVVVDPRK